MSTPTPTHTAVPHVQATAPERIYLVIGEDVEPDTDFDDLGRGMDSDGVTWCADKIDDNSIPYVRADLASLPAPQGERENVVAAWNDLPDALRCHPGLKRLYRALAFAPEAMGASQDSRTPTVAPGGQPLPRQNSQDGFGDSVPASVEPSGATLSPGGHASDCATHNAPAYPPGPCDCLPTPQMCRAAVEYANGADVYDRVPREVLEIEEGIYAEIWRAMQAVAPQVPALSPCAASQWISVSERLPPLNTEVLIAFAENTLPSTGQYTDNPYDHDGWSYPRENVNVLDGSFPTVTHWAFMRHPNEIGEWAQVDRGESSSEGGES